MKRFALTFTGVRDFNFSCGELEFIVTSYPGQDDYEDFENGVELEEGLTRLSAACPNLSEISVLD